MHSCASGVPIVRIALCKRPPIAISYVYFVSVGLSVRLFSFMSVNLRHVLNIKHFTSDNTSPNTNPKTNPACTSLPGFRLQTRIYYVHTEGEGIRLRSMHVDGGGGPAPCGRPHRKLKLESTDVILSSCHAKKLASFLPEFRLWTEKK